MVIFFECRIVFSVRLGAMISSHSVALRCSLNAEDLTWLAELIRSIHTPLLCLRTWGHDGTGALQDLLVCSSDFFLGASTQAGKTKLL